jgi:hypothetical protein
MSSRKRPSTESENQTSSKSSKNQNEIPNIEKLGFYEMYGVNSVKKEVILAKSKLPIYTLKFLRLFIK